MRRAILVNIGADRTHSVGILSPLFEDGSYELIPAVESYNFEGLRLNWKINIPLTYAELKVRSKFLRRIPNINSILDILPKDKILEGVPPSEVTIHYDPEFNSWTLGEYAHKRKVLKHIERGDYIIFTALFCPLSFKDAKRLYHEKNRSYSSMRKSQYELILKWRKNLVDRKGELWKIYTKYYRDIYNISWLEKKIIPIYIVAYMKVKDIYITNRMENMKVWIEKKAKIIKVLDAEKGIFESDLPPHIIRSNIHFLRTNIHDYENLVILIGDPKESKVLKKPIFLFSDKIPHSIIDRFLSKGLSGIQSMIIRGKDLQMLLRFLKEE